MNRVELVSTGDELLSGRTINSHAQTLGQELSVIGLRLTRDTTVPDDPQIIREAIQDALNRANIVFCTGGLGPTDDDVTRATVAAMLGRKLTPDALALTSIQKRCETHGNDFNEYRIQQADIIEGATALPNRVGAAPGERLNLENNRTLFILPGPPTEFTAILNDHVLPWLKENITGKSAFMEKIYLTCGLPESDALALFRANGFPPSGIDIAYCAAAARLEIRLASQSGDLELLNKADAKLRELLGSKLFADKRTTMEEIIGKLLTENNATLAVAESCTGGLLGARITSIPGSSKYFIGGILSYSNTVKIDHLGIDPNTLEKDGAVSATVAGQMALGVMKKLNADYGLAITGIAGPGGGTTRKPAGLVYIGLANTEKVQTERHLFGNGRSLVRLAATRMALDMLRKHLTKSSQRG